MWAYAAVGLPVAAPGKPACGTICFNNRWSRDYYNDEVETPGAKRRRSLFMQAAAVMLQVCRHGGFSGVRSLTKPDPKIRQQLALRGWQKDDHRGLGEDDTSLQRPQFLWYENGDKQRLRLYPSNPIADWDP